MDIVQIILIGMVAALLFMTLKDIQPSFAFFITIITSVFILMIVIKHVSIVIQLLTLLGEKASIQSFYLSIILKIIGIAYITELGANLTKDAGLSSVSSKIELAGKIFILILAVPIITAVVEMILGFLPTTNFRM